MTVNLRKKVVGSSIMPSKKVFSLLSIHCFASTNYPLFSKQNSKKVQKYLLSGKKIPDIV